MYAVPDATKYKLVKSSDTTNHQMNEHANIQHARFDNTNKLDTFDCHAANRLKHLWCTMGWASSSSSYSPLDIHICWNVDKVSTELCCAQWLGQTS